MQLPPLAEQTIHIYNQFLVFHQRLHCIIDCYYESIHPLLN